MEKRLTKHNFERGQSLVELSVSLVFLLLLLGGAIDFGRAFFTYIALRDAAQEGAIFGSYCPAQTANIIQRVQNSASGTSINTTVIQIGSGDITYTDPFGNPSDDSPGNLIHVHATINFDITMPFMGTVVGRQSFPISTTIINTILKNDGVGCES